MDEAQRKFEENKALMGSKFDLMVYLAKLEIEGDKEQKDRVIRKRINEYFHYNSSIDVANDHFYPREEPDYRD